MVTVSLLLDKFVHPYVESCTELDSCDPAHYYIEWTKKINFVFDKSVKTRVSKEKEKEKNLALGRKNSRKFKKEVALNKWFF